MRYRHLQNTHFPHTDRVLAVLNYQVWHKRPAAFDDVILVRLQVRAVGVRLQFQYKVNKLNETNEELIAEAETVHIPLDRQFKPQRPSPQLMQQLEKEQWIETWLSNS